MNEGITPRRVSVKDLAAILNVSENHIRDLAAEGQIAGTFRIGRRIRFDLERALASLEQT